MARARVMIWPGLVILAIVVSVCFQAFRYDNHNLLARAFDSSAYAAENNLKSGAKKKIFFQQNGQEEWQKNFCQGMKEFRTGRFAKARPYLEAANAAQSEDLGDYVLYYLGRCLEEVRGNKQAVLLFLALIEQFPQSRFASKTRLHLADNFFFLKDYKLALKYYLASSDNLPQDREYIYFQIALALIEENRLREAGDFLKKIMVEYPTGQYAESSEACRQELENKLGSKLITLSEHDQFEILHLLMEARQYEKALGLIKKVKAGKEFKKSDKIRISDKRWPDLLYQEALCQSKLGKKDESLEILTQIINLYPSSESALSSLLLKGNLLWNQDQDNEAIDTFKKAAYTFPRRENADKAWYYMGRIFEQNKKYQKAVDSFDRLVKNFPKSKYFSESLWRIGWVYYQEGKFGKAQQYFANGSSRVKEDSERHRFVYWQARSAEKNKEITRAKSIYRSLVQDNYYSYYSWFALQRLGGDKAVVPPLKLLSQAEAGIAQIDLSEEISFHLKRAKKLIEYSLNGEAAGEVQALAKISSSNPYYWYQLGKLAEQTGVFGQMMFAGYKCRKLLAERGQPSGYAEVGQLLYPLAYWDLIKKYADKYDLDPHLVSALMRQESAFDPLSLSCANAYGLMQIIPSTARIIASKIGGLSGRKNFQMERLYQPEVNIAFGCFYLAGLLEKCDGNLVHVLISYNAGENALQKWLNRYQNVELDEFVEYISYRETRHYVKKVLENYISYLRLYRKISPPGPVMAKVNKGLKD